MSTPLPSCGRIVWYFGKLGVLDELGGPFAALVVDVGPGPDVCTLKITGRNGTDYVRANVPHDEMMDTRGSWCWPTRIG